MRNDTSISRRQFVQGGGLALGATCCALHFANAQDGDPLTAFLPCVDYPVRLGPNDPIDPTPVEYALEFSEDGMGAVDGAPRSPAGARALDNLGGPAPRSPGDTIARAPARLAAMNRWEGVTTLEVRFNGGTSDLHEHVLRLANEWKPFSGIEFKGSTSRNAQILCGFITNRRDPKFGHWSYVGTDSNNFRDQTMNLAITGPSLDKTPYHQAVVRHEFGHALGCIHEHQNPGANGIQFHRDKTIAYFKQTYGWERQMTIDNVLTRYSARKLQRFSDFDPKSIMLYAYPGSITVDGRGTDQNFALSPTDQEFMAKLYGVVPPPKDGDDPEDKAKVAASEQTLVVGDPAAKGMVTAKVSNNRYRFSIGEAGTYTIKTNGYTQVAFSKLTDAAGKPVDLKDRVFTTDLVNQIARPILSVGQYQLELTHQYSGGVGEYGIQLLKGEQ